MSSTSDGVGGMPPPSPSPVNIASGAVLEGNDKVGGISEAIVDNVSVNILSDNSVIETSTIEDA